MSSIAQKILIHLIFMGLLWLHLDLLDGNKVGKKQHKWKSKRYFEVGLIGKEKGKKNKKKEYKVFKGNMNLLLLLRI